MMAHRLFPIAALVLLTGCFRQHVPDPYMVAGASRPLRCTRGDDCDVKWSRAVQRLTMHSTWKLRNVTDFLITTEGPGDTWELAYSIQKLAEGDGVYRIQADAWCADIPATRMLGCIPKREEALAAFADFVEAGH